MKPIAVLSAAGLAAALLPFVVARPPATRPVPSGRAAPLVAPASRPAPGVAAPKTEPAPVANARAAASRKSTNAAPAPRIAPAAAPPATAAMNVERDEAGALVPGKALPAGAATLQSQAAAPIEIRLADGTVGLEFPNGMLEYVVVDRTPDGRWVHSCVQGHAHGQARIDSLRRAPAWEDQ